jgi:hypothetical protein
MRERRMGKDASLGEEAVLADSGRAGEKSDSPSILIMEQCRSVSHANPALWLALRGL